MRRYTLWIGVFAVTVLAGAAWAEQDTKKEEPALRMELDLVDGSHIIGTPGIETVPVETSYAKMKLPFSQIVAMKIGEDHETVSFDLQNGDTIKGVINLGPIPLDTAFGKITVNTEPLRIGKRKDADFDPGSNNYFNGRLDDIRIYNRVLSDEEIQGICRGRK